MISARIKYIGILALLAICITPSFFAFAQTTSGTIPDGQIPDQLQNYNTAPNAGDIDATMDPQNPGSFQPVTITLDSNLVDLRRYTISWFVNGTAVGSGYGKTVLTTQTQGYGQPLQIIASIALDTGTVQKTMSVTPEDMSMMWEAVDSYVPPFYEGKKLPSRQGIVKIVAIPNFMVNGKTLDPANAVFSWKRNSNVVTTASGYGNDALVIKHNPLNAVEKIQATASDVNNTAQATAGITVPFFDPKILFYQTNPTTHINSPIALGSLNLGTGSAIITAEPFFFSVPNNNQTVLPFNWTMNGTAITLPNNQTPQTLVLQNPGGNGNSSIDLNIASNISNFQTAENSLFVSFGQ